MRTWILQRFHWYARTLLRAGLLLSPVIFYRGTVDVFNLVKITTLWVLGLGALALWIASAVERRVFVPRMRLAVPALVFLAGAALATVFSQNPALSLVGLYHRYGGLIPFALYAAVALTLVGLYWERPGDLREIANTATAASVVMAAYVLIQAAGQDWIQWKDAAGRPPEFPVGTMGNSNFAGGYLGIVAPFFLYSALTVRREIWRNVALVALGFDLLALWFTQTRGGMIAAGAGLLTVALMSRDRLPAWGRAALMAVPVLAVLVAVLVVWHPGSERPPGPLSRIETFRTGTLVIRSYYWGTAWRIFLDHPLLGTGLDTYFANYPRYRSPADGAELGLVITDKPHNIYLEYAANAGIVGVGSYLALVGMGVWFGYRRRRSVDGPELLLVSSFVGVLAGYLAQGVFSIDVPPLAAMGWVGLAGVAVLADPGCVAARERLEAARARRPGRPGKRDRGTSRPPRDAPAFQMGGPARWRVHAGVGLVTALLLGAGLRPFRADAKASAAQRDELARSPFEKVAAAYGDAVRLHPLEPAYRTSIAASAEGRASATNDPAEKRRLLERALSHHGEALRLQPRNVFYLMNVARVHTVLARELEPERFAEADRWWSRAVAQDPTDWEIHHRYAQMLDAWATAAKDPAIRRRAADRLETVTRIRPGLASAWVDLGKVYRALGEDGRARAALEQALAIEPANGEARAALASL